MKNKILQHGCLVLKFPSNRFIYQQVFLLKKQYRNRCRSAKRNYFNSLSQNIEDLCLKNDKNFWSVLKSVQSVNEDYLPDSHCLYNYFEQLHSVQESDNSLYSENVQNIVAKQLECLEPYLYEHNNHITTLEVSNTIKNLKGNKAHYQDFISNEMLKYAGDIILEPLAKLFNSVICSGHYPDEWCCGNIVPIFKSGDKNYQKTTEV